MSCGKLQNSELGIRLWKARIASGKSVPQLSEETGISKRSIWYYENGEIDVKSKKLALLCKALDVSSDWLLGLSEIHIDKQFEQPRGM